MSDKKYIPAGFIRKPHGVKGEVKIVVEELFETDVARAKVFFVELHGNPMPYFVLQQRVGNDWLVTFEDCTSKEDAQVICNKPLLLRESDLSKKTLKALSQTTQLLATVGYAVVDAHLGTIGTVLHIEEYPHQLMATLQTPVGEQLLPLNEVFVTDLNKAKKIIYTNLPEGLIATPEA